MHNYHEIISSLKFVYVRRPNKQKIPQNSDLSIWLFGCAECVLGKIIDSTCWRWAGNGTRMKFAWIISFWFRFLLTVNKYYTIILSNGLKFFGIPHYSALNYKDMRSGRFGNRSHWHVQHSTWKCTVFSIPKIFW